MWQFQADLAMWCNLGSLGDFCTAAVMAASDANSHFARFRVSAPQYALQLQSREN
jgi:hypothetical protein